MAWVSWANKFLFVLKPAYNHKSPVWYILSRSSQGKKKVLRDQVLLCVLINFTQGLAGVTLSFGFKKIWHTFSSHVCGGKGPCFSLGIHGCGCGCVHVGVCVWPWGQELEEWEGSTWESSGTWFRPGWTLNQIRFLHLATLLSLRLSNQEHNAVSLITPNHCLDLSMLGRSCSKSGWQRCWHFKIANNLNLDVKS